jgi:hypothetical protein
MSTYLTMLQFHLGVLLGWATHPLLWLHFSPWRLMFYLGVTASQESGWDPTIAGDTEDPRGNSLGLLQFHKPTRTALGISDDAAKSPLWSGYYGGVYINEALLSDWGWWIIRAPYYGAGALRVLWRGGIGSADDWRDGLTTEYAGAAYWPTYWRWVTLPTLLTLATLIGVYKYSKKRIAA